MIPVIFSQKHPTFSDLTSHGTTIPTTWSGQKVPKTVRYLFWADATHFHFLCKSNNGPGLCHPESQLSTYQDELWKYDVAEFFLMSSDQSRYLEFNLGPNGSWWTSAFTKPRKAARGEPSAVPDVLTSAQQDEDSWQAMASIPLSWLKTHYGFGEKNTLNATFILNSPDQIFLTAGDLGKGIPDFHRPDRFPPMRVISLA